MRISLLNAVAASSIAAVGVWGQGLGTVTLPLDLADAGVQVMGVLNKNPQNNQTLGFCEGPSVDAQGNVYFTESGTNARIWKATGIGAGSVFGGNTNYASNGTEIDHMGRLTVCQREALATYDAGGARTVLATTEPNVVVNDITIGSTGALYFSHWGANVFYRSATGQITKIPGFSTGNGLEWVEERKKLYVAQDGPDQVWVYDVAADGKLANGKMFVSVPEPDGMTVDEKGNLYFASWMDGKVMVFDTTGKSLGSITVTGVTGGPGTTGGPMANVANVVIGADKKIYMAGDGGLYSAQLKVGPRKRPGATAILAFGRAGNRTLRSGVTFDPSRGALLFFRPGGNGKPSLTAWDTRGRIFP